MPLLLYSTVLQLVRKFSDQDASLLNGTFPGPLNIPINAPGKSMAQARFRRARHSRARPQTGSQTQSRDCRAHIPARFSHWAGLAGPYSASYTAWPGLAAHVPVAQGSQVTRE